MTGSVLVATDWVVIAGYLGLVLAIGIFFARRGSSSTGGYFLAGRSLPWWVAGTSIVATTFSSDTPLQVVSLVRQGGIGENWWWWSMAAGHAAGVFLFAPLWLAACWWAIRPQPRGETVRIGRAAAPDAEREPAPAR